MERKGFTLIEVLIGIFILGLISVTFLPLIGNSAKLSSENFQGIEMDYLGEMIIEKLKAFEYDSSTSTYICETSVEEIVDLLKLEKTSNASFTFKGEHGDYSVLIEKSQRSSSLWEILVSIKDIEEGDKKSVKFKAFLPSK